MALTVGVATVLAAREVVVVVTGQRKALALSKSIEEGVNHLVRHSGGLATMRNIHEFAFLVDVIGSPASSMGAHRR